MLSLEAADPSSIPSTRSFAEAPEPENEMPPPLTPPPTSAALPVKLKRENAGAPLPPSAAVPPKKVNSASSWRAQTPIPASPVVVPGVED